MKTGIQYMEAIQFFLIAMATALASAVTLAGIVLLLSAPTQAVQQFDESAQSAQILHKETSIKIRSQ